MIRVGVEASIDESMLLGFTDEVELVSIPEKPTSAIEIDFGSPHSHRPLHARNGHICATSR